MSRYTIDTSFKNCKIPSIMPREIEKRYTADDYCDLFNRLNKQDLLLNESEQSIVSRGTSASVIKFEMQGVNFSVISSTHTLLKFLSQVSEEGFDNFLNKKINAQDVVTLARGGGIIYTKDEISMGEGLITIGNYCQYLLSILGSETINNQIQDGSRPAMKSLALKYNLLSKIIVDGKLLNAKEIKKIVKKNNN